MAKTGSFKQENEHQYKPSCSSIYDNAHTISPSTLLMDIFPLTVVSGNAGPKNFQPNTTANDGILNDKVRIDSYKLLWTI